MSICWNRLSPKVADSYIAVWKILLRSQDTELYERWQTVLSWSQDMGPEGSGSLSVQLLNNDTQPSSFLISSQISRLKFLRVHIFFTTHDKPTNKKTTKNNKKQQKTNKKQNKTKQNIKLLPHGIWKHFFSLSAIIGKRKALVPECSAGERPGDKYAC